MIILNNSKKAPEIQMKITIPPRIINGENTIQRLNDGNRNFSNSKQSAMVKAMPNMIL